MLRALVVDDSRAIRRILAKFLQELGLEVAESGTGLEALARLDRGEPVDLMLVDWNMPGMNGYDLIRSVRANPMHEQIRIIMVTTETSLSQLQLALSAGANEYVMKPFTKDVLREKLAIVGIA